MAKTEILSLEKIKNILKRIAIQIYESNHDSDEIVLVGVVDQGFEMAKFIKKELSQINPEYKVDLMSLSIAKPNPLATPIKMDRDIQALKDKVVIVVDDVLNTGRTLIYGLKYLLDVDIKKLETAVLVKRSHSLFPISATFSGYEVSTTLDEHIEVTLDGPEAGAFLF